jgi:cytoskeletal protein CcmA (bactofilin family)
MWKRDQAVRSSDTVLPAPAADSNPPAAPAPIERTIQRPRTPRNEIDMVNIGKSVVIKGELTGSEDLMVEGRVEGTIQLRDHVFTIGPNGNIAAQVFARAVVVLGSIKGDISATDKVEIRDGGSVEGNIVSPRVAIAEGAHFRGSVDMQKKAAKPAAAESSASVQTKPSAASPQQGVPIAAAPAR